MTTRSTFLLGSGATLLGAGATGAAAAVAAPNIIIPGRGGTAYFANLPAWTPKEALHHPATAMLNQMPRFTPRMRRALRNFEQVMASKIAPDANICGLGRTRSLQVSPFLPPHCPGDPTPPPPPPRYFTGSNRLYGPSTPNYTGRQLVASKALPVIDGYGAQMNGYSTSATTYAIGGYGQNPATITQSGLPSMASGKFQYGTTTITQHPTLPMTRYTDPYFGSGVGYYDQASSKTTLASTNGLPDTFVTGPTRYPHPVLSAFGYIGLALTVVGIAIGAATIAGIAVATLAPAAAALGVGAGVVALAVAIFVLIAGAMDTPLSSPSSSWIPDPGNISIATVPSAAAPPDGLGVTGALNGTYPTGGGGAGSEEYYVY